uniref:Uncharacterized protein n=1 Tax=Syphacia muris TaxID=451379 RepID=A0A0N5ARJ3_9BILA
MIPQKLLSNRAFAAVTDHIPSTSTAVTQQCINHQTEQKNQLNERTADDNQAPSSFSSFQAVKHLFKVFGRKAENFFGVPPEESCGVDLSDPDADIRRARRHLRYILRNYGGFNPKELVKTLKRQKFFERHSCEELATNFEEFIDPKEFTVLASEVSA